MQEIARFYNNSGKCLEYSRKSVNWVVTTQSSIYSAGLLKIRCLADCRTFHAGRALTLKYLNYMRIPFLYPLFSTLLFISVNSLAAESDLKAKIASGPSVTGSSTTTDPATILPKSTIPRLDCLIEPNMMVDLATSVSGVVRTVNVDRGDLIKTGQILAQLEAEVEKANVAHSNAQVEFSTKKYHRMQELLKEHMVSAQQMEEAKTEHDVAVAELRKTIELLNQRTVFSPFNGVVVDRYVSPGEFVDGKKVIKVAQINPLRVEVIAPIKLLGEFKIGGKMQVYPEGPVSGPFEASVQLVDRVIDAPSGTFRVRLLLPNQKYQISAGVRCKAEIAQAKVEKKGVTSAKKQPQTTEKPKSAEVKSKTEPSKSNAPVNHSVEAPLPSEPKKTVGPASAGSKTESHIDRSSESGSNPAATGEKNEEAKSSESSASKPEQTEVKKEEPKKIDPLNPGGFEAEIQEK